MKKALLILLAAMLLLACVACGANDKPNPTESTAQTEATKPDAGKEVTATPAEIEAKIAAALGDGYVCTVDIDEESLAGYDIDMSKVEAFAAKESTITAVYLDKVLIFKVKDGYAEALADALNASYAHTVSYIRLYPFGTEKVVNARLYVNGNYVAFILAGATADGEATGEEEARLAEAEYAKIDAVWKEIFGTVPDNAAIVPEDSGEHGGGGFIG